MTKEELNLYLKGNYKINNLVLNEIDYIIKKNNYKPKIFIAYDRESFISKDDNLRITFDKNLRSKEKNLDIDDCKDCNLFFEENKYIFEIKTLESMPIWLSKILSKLRIFPISFSKYGEIYKKGMINNV